MSILQVRQCPVWYATVLMMITRFISSLVIIYYASFYLFYILKHVLGILHVNDIYLFYY
jgi:hypothetical protein